MDIQPHKDVLRKKIPWWEGKYVHAYSVPMDVFFLAMTMCAHSMLMMGFIFTIRRKREKIRSPGGGRRDVVLRGITRRTFRTILISFNRTFLALEVQRVGCRRCGCLRQTLLGFADPRFSYTRAFERYAPELSRLMTMREVAQHRNVSWDVIQEIQKRDLLRRFSKPTLKHVRRIASGEIAVRKEHQYLTIVLDMISGPVIFVGDGKGAAARDPFWRRLRRAELNIEAVTMEIATAYIGAVLIHLPGATIVFDHFHVIKLSDLRRDLYREARESSTRTTR